MEQLTGPGRDIRHAGVLRAMAEVPRREFLPLEELSRAGEDSPLPIGFGQTISQPFVVAFMTAQLDPKATDKILEVGAGSGYQAAVLSRLARKVYSVEIVPELAERAAAAWERLGYDNIQVRAGDGRLGWPEEAPFDAIMVTCAAASVPPALIDQLKEGGRMILPLGPAAGASQELVLAEKSDGNLLCRPVLPVRFVPMTGG